MRDKDKDKIDLYIDKIKLKPLTTKEKKAYKYKLNKIKQNKKDIKRLTKSIDKISNPFEANYDDEKLAKQNRKLYRLIDKQSQDVKTIESLKDRFEMRITINISGDKVRVKESYLKRLKEPAKYIERLYENRLDRRIAKEKESGDAKRVRNAYYLATKVNKSKPTFKEQKVREIFENYYRLKNDDDSDLGDYEGLTDGDLYDLIINISETGLKVTFI